MGVYSKFEYSLTRWMKKDHILLPRMESFFSEYPRCSLWLRNLRKIFVEQGYRPYFIVELLQQNI